LCRRAAAVGREVDPNPLRRALSDLAREKGQGDGWGVALYRAGRLLLYYREERPLWERRVGDLPRADLIVAHARKKSCGDPKLENSHPFVAALGGGSGRWHTTGASRERP